VRVMRYVVIVCSIVCLSSMFGSSIYMHITGISPVWPMFPFLLSLVILIGCFLIAGFMAMFD
jgi:hypothetical protein